MPVKTAARTAAAPNSVQRAMILPAALANLQTIMQTPFGSIGLTPKGAKGRPRSAASLHSPDAAAHIAHDVRLAMVGRLFMLGTLQLLAGLLPMINTEQPVVRQRAPWGSKSGKAARKAKAKA